MVIDCLFEVAQWNVLSVSFASSNLECQKQATTTLAGTWKAYKHACRTSDNAVVISWNVRHARRNRV
jgi:hypothetical protein